MPIKRTSISKRIRFEIFKRDEFTCQYCGAVPPKTILHVDHINPVFSGGTNDIDNLVTSCMECNLGKGARNLKNIPQSLAEKAKLVAESEAQLLGYQNILQAKHDRIEDEQWRVAEIIFPGSSETGINRHYLSSLKYFIDQIGLFVVMDAAEIATRKWSNVSTKRFKYFCAICWNRIREQT